MVKVYRILNQNPDIRKHPKYSQKDIDAAMQSVFNILAEYEEISEEGLLKIMRSLGHSQDVMKYAVSEHEKSGLLERMDATSPEDSREYEIILVRPTHHLWEWRGNVVKKNREDITITELQKNTGCP
jgi:hypothetical protein